MSDQPENQEQESRPILADRDITVEGSFTVSRGAPICPVCRAFDLDTFTGRIPYPIAGFDVADWPTEPDLERDPPFDPESLYPFDATVTAACPCSEFVSYKMHAELDEGQKPKLTFEYFEADRLSRVTKDRGVLGWLPNYRD